MENDLTVAHILENLKVPLSPLVPKPLVPPAEPPREWYYSLNGETGWNGPHDSKDGAVAAARDCEAESLVNGKPFWVGTKENYVPFEFDLLECLMEQEAVTADDIAGEAADTWPFGINKKSPEYMDANETLRKILRGIFGEPDFYTLNNVTEIGPND